MTVRKFNTQHTENFWDVETGEPFDVLVDERNLIERAAKTGFSLGDICTDPTVLSVEVTYTDGGFVRLFEVQE